MIYIGKFLHATNQQRTKEENRRHGEFNLIIEADDEQTAVDKFKERIKEFRGKTELFEATALSTWFISWNWTNFPKIAPECCTTNQSPEIR